MYAAVLLIHSWLRWLVIVAGLIATAQAIGGVTRGRAWTPADDRAGRWFTILLDVQSTLGLILYFFLSPFTLPWLRNLAEAMRNSGVRFWIVEHAFGMLVALALVHVAQGRIRKSADARRKHRTAALVFTIALIAILISVPWPGTPNSRPLLRW